MTAREALRFRRIANGAEKSANENAAQDFPWSLGNLRLYQNLMADAMERRSIILHGYLNARASRRKEKP